MFTLCGPIGGLFILVEGLLQFTYDSQLSDLEAEKEKLRKQINDLELKARKEVQSKKKFEMVQRVNLYKERLKDMQ